eukprot:1160821-Pelagomonas_calceolata.AAC.7
MFSAGSIANDAIKLVKPVLPAVVGNNRIFLQQNMPCQCILAWLSLPHASFCQPLFTHPP